MGESLDLDDDFWEWEFVEIFKEFEVNYVLDEVGNFFLFDYYEEILLFCKWDVVCVVLEFVIFNNLE